MQSETHRMQFEPVTQIEIPGGMGKYVKVPSKCKNPVMGSTAFGVGASFCILTHDGKTTGVLPPRSSRKEVPVV